MTRRWFLKFLQSLSTTGLFLGTLFFVASLTPTLIPRTYVTQGVLSGACFAAGYGIGVLCRKLYVYLELPLASAPVARIANIIAGALCVAGAIWCLWQTTYWQNSIRLLMGMEPLTSANPYKISAIAAVTFFILLKLGVFFEFVHRFVSEKIGRVVPRRISNAVGIAVAVVLFWTIANGVIFRFALHVLDNSFQQRDALFEPEREKPVSASKTGSVASLLRWDELGRTGRAFIAGGPSAADISAFTKKDAMEPIRVYVGLRAADTPEARARLALEEMKRVKAFERSVLVVITPT
ncbi:MAG TPA: alpha/beta-hydrolase N-terminal domain-containing protein, partial [Afipia sp.]